MRARDNLSSAVARAALILALTSASAAAQQPAEHKAEEVKPYKAQEIQPYKAQEIQPDKAQEVQPVKAQEVKPYKAQEVKPIGPAGVDRVTPAGPLDPALVGSWDLAIPGVAYQTESDRGTYTERTLHTGAGATFGRLTISARGAYTWTKSGETARGRLVEVTPRRDAVAGARYWALRHGRELFYLTRGSDGALSVYTVGANSYVAAGQRAR